MSKSNGGDFYIDLFWNPNHIHKIFYENAQVSKKNPVLSTLREELRTSDQIFAPLGCKGIICQDDLIPSRQSNTRRF